MSLHLNHLLGSTITLYILPLAGAESAVALALLVSFYPTLLYFTLISIGIMLMAAKLIGAGIVIVTLALLVSLFIRQSSYDKDESGS